MLGSALAAEVSRQKAKGRETDLILVRVTAHGVGRLLGVRLLALRNHSSAAMKEQKIEAYLRLRRGSGAIGLALHAVTPLLSMRLLRVGLEKRSAQVRRTYSTIDKP